MAKTEAWNVVVVGRKRARGWLAMVMTLLTSFRGPRYPSAHHHHVAWPTLAHVAASQQIKSAVRHAPIAYGCALARECLTDEVEELFFPRTRGEEEGAA